MSLFSLFKEEEPISFEQCSDCEGEGVVEWTKLTVINKERIIHTK